MPYKESITNEELNQLPLGMFDGNIVIVDTPEGMERACEHLAGCGILGFDTETRPSFKKGRLNSMSLVQLSCKDTAFLLRINKTPLTGGMLSILSDEKVIKVGASIRDDIKGIRKLFPFEPGGFADIQSMVHGYGINDLSVRKVSGIVLGIRISKAQRLSNWEAQRLTPAQQLYAATDAWACREVYMRLKNIKD